MEGHALSWSPKIQVLGNKPAQSMESVRLPYNIADDQTLIVTDVVEKNIPLLISKSEEEIPAQYGRGICGSDGKEVPW